MKKTVISTFAALAFAVVASNNAGAASYTLKPVSADESNVFKAKPTIIFRVGQDTKADADKLVEKLYFGNLNSELVDFDSDGNFTRLKDAIISKDGGRGGSAMDLFNKFGSNSLDAETALKKAQVLTGNIGVSVSGVYACEKINTKGSVAKETCTGESDFETVMEFETHIVDVTAFKNQILIAKRTLNEGTLTEEQKDALTKLIERAEAVLNNQNAIQSEINAAYDEIHAGIEKPVETVAEVEKKAEEEAKKAEEDKKKQEAKEEKTADKEKTSTESKDSSEVKAPNTGFNQENSALAFISTFGVLLLGATIYRLKK